VDLQRSCDEAPLLEDDVPAGLRTRRTLDGQASRWKRRESSNNMEATTTPDLTQVHINAEYQAKLVVLVLEIV